MSEDCGHLWTQFRSTGRGGSDPKLQQWLWVLKQAALEPKLSLLAWPGWLNARQGWSQRQHAQRPVPHPWSQADSDAPWALCRPPCWCCAGVLRRGAAGSWREGAQREVRDHLGFGQPGPVPITNTSLACPGITGKDEATSAQDGAVGRAGTQLRDVLPGLTQL